AGMQHPNIVQIYEVGQWEDRSYLALEYVAGGTLQERLAGTPQAPRVAAELVETLARAVQHAHERGVIHRDLKPSNVLLVSGVSCLVFGSEAPSPSPHTTHEPPTTKHQTRNTCVPKITDFGLAKQLDGAGDQTRTGMVVGTPSYMAPEQAQGK